MFGKTLSAVDNIEDTFREVEQSWIETTERDMVSYLFGQIQDNGGKYPIPAEVIDCDATASVDLRTRELKGWAIAKAEDGRTYKYTFSEWHHRGSYYDVIEPPEDDYNLSVEEI